MPAWFGPGAVGKGAAHSGNLANGLPVFKVLTEAIAQIPTRYRKKIIFRADGAGATKDLLSWIKSEAAEKGYSSPGITASDSPSHGSTEPLPLGDIAAEPDRKSVV